MIHLLVLIVYRPLARISLFPENGEEARAARVEPIVFELVETPDDAIRQKPTDGNLLSDKNAVARDTDQDESRPRGDAYSEGQIEHRVFVGRPESGAAAESAVGKNSARPGAESRDRLRESDPGASAEPSGGQRIQRPEPERDYLSKADRSSLSLPSVYTDDLQYDQRRFSAETLGGITLNTYAWDYAAYILEMKRKLRANVFPPSAFSPLGIISGETVIRFRVEPDGKVSGIKVIEYTGHRTLMETSVGAVEYAAPFRPLPEDFPEEYLELTWTFGYYLIR